MPLPTPHVLSAWCAGAALLASLLSAGSAWAGDPLRDRQWYLDVTHTDEAQRAALGAGVTVAVLDSGVDAEHPDLAGQVEAGPDLVDGSGSGHDADGHGTNVAGIIAAHRGNGIGITGMAPAARILSIRVLDANGGGSTDTEATGIDAAVAAGAQVINLSLGPSPDALRSLDPLDPLGPAIQRAVDAGVIVVAAAGNYAVPLCVQPIIVRGMLCVGSIERSQQRADYSDYGVRVDLVAPGGGAADGGVVSTKPGGDYAAMMGTSQASPQVAAVAAMLIGAGLRGQAVIDRILQTARDLGIPGEDAEFGHGALDAGAALSGFPALPAATDATIGAAPAPAPVTVRLPDALPVSRILSRQGLRLRLRVARAGRWRARLTVRGTAVARGARTLRARRIQAVVLRRTRAAGRLLRHGRRRAARLTLIAPDGAKAVRIVRLRR